MSPCVVAGANTLEDYVSVYDVVADKIATDIVNCDEGKPALHPIVTGCPFLKLCGCS